MAPRFESSTHAMHVWASWYARICSRVQTSSLQLKIRSGGRRIVLVSQYEVDTRITFVCNKASGSALSRSSG